MPPTLKTAPKPPRYLQWRKVVSLTKGVGLTEYNAKVLFKSAGSEARKVLREGQNPVYLESVVLATLGIEV